MLALFLAVAFSHLVVGGASMLYRGAMGKHSIFSLNLRLVSSMTLIAATIVYAILR